LLFPAHYPITTRKAPLIDPNDDDGATTTDDDGDDCVVIVVEVVVAECSLATCNSVCRPLLQRKRRGFVSYILIAVVAVVVSSLLSLSISPHSLSISLSISLSLCIGRASSRGLPGRVHWTRPENIENRQTNDCILCVYNNIIYCVYLHFT